MDTQDQEQSSGFDPQAIIQSLVSLLLPNEAGAATRAPQANQIPRQATPVTNLPPVPGQTTQPDYTGMNISQAMQMRNQLVQQQMAQQRLAMQQQAAQAKMNQPDVGVQIAKALGPSGGTTEPQDVLFRGVTPGTGTPYFSNFRAPEGYAPEVQRQQFLKDYAARQAAMAAPTGGAGGLDPRRLALHAQLVQGLTKAGYSPSHAGNIADAAFPDIAKATAEPKQQGVQTTKETNYIQSHIKDFYNKDTGEPAGMAQATGNIDPNEFRKQYIELNTDQKKNVDAVNAVSQQIDMYRNLATDLNRTAKPGFINTIQNYVNTKAGRFANDPNVTSLDAARAQATQLARGFGGDSRVSDKEMAMLNGAIITDSDNQESIKSKMAILQKFRDAKAKQIGVPWLMKGAQQQQSDTTGGGTPQAGATTPPPGAVDTGRTFKGKKAYHIPGQTKLWVEP